MTLKRLRVYNVNVTKSVTTITIIKKVVKIKKILSAFIEQIIQFDDDRELDKLTKKLTERKQDFQIVSSYHNQEGKLIVKIRKQYNNNVLGGE